ncbi:MAG: hypothetical protein Q7S03_01180 [bacterium]|nr:hypothetical protein [bacterium]
MDEELKKRLLEFGLTEEQVEKLEAEGVKEASDVSLLTADEVKILSGCGTIVAKKVAAAFVQKALAVETGVSEQQQAAMTYDSILPVVPEDSSFIEMLKTGGVLKIGAVDVMSAMRAAIADRVGLYKLPDVILQRMEHFAEEQDEPVGENFWTLQKLITTRNYGEILSALGVPGTFVSDRRKTQVLQRLNVSLWSTLRGFQDQLKEWYETWTQTAFNPTILLGSFIGARTGMAIPPGLGQPPDTAGLRDAAEEVVNQVNKVFAGVGIPVARALAWDATRIKGILEEPTLPAAIGVATREQMLKALGVDVSSDYVRLERNITRYALSIMELPKVAAGNEEMYYLNAMLMLGGSIPWDRLIGLSSEPKSDNRRREEEQPVMGSGFRSSPETRSERGERGRTF